MDRTQSWPFTAAQVQTSSQPWVAVEVTQIGTVTAIAWPSEIIMASGGGSDHVYPHGFQW